MLDPLRGHGLAVCKNMAVARCLRHLRVAKNGARRPEVELVFEHHRRRRMAQVVEPLRWDIGLGAKQLEGSGIGPGVQRPSGRVREDPTPSRPEIPHLGGQALGNLRAPVHLELREDARRQRQDTASRVGLGLPHVQSPAPALRAVRAPLAGTRDAEAIDVGAGQALFAAVAPGPFEVSCWRPRPRSRSDRTSLGHRPAPGLGYVGSAIFPANEPERWQERTAALGAGRWALPRPGVLYWGHPRPVSLVTCSITMPALARRPP